MVRGTWRRVAAVALAGVMAACSGGGSDGTADETPPSTPPPDTTPATAAAPATTTTTIPPLPIEVGVDWRRFGVADDVRLLDGAVAAERLWVVGVRGKPAEPGEQGPVLFSTTNGDVWDEHDLRDLGVPHETLCGTDSRLCQPAAVVLASDGEAVHLLVDAGYDREPLVRDRWLVTGTADALTVHDTDALGYGPWPESEWSDLHLARPSHATAVDGRVIAVANGQWVPRLEMGVEGARRTLVTHLIDPAGGSSVWAAGAPPLEVTASSVGAVRHTSLGLVVLGTQSGGGATLVPSLWTSADGTTWDGPAALHPSLLDPDSEERHFYRSITEGPAGLVVAGTVDPEGRFDPTTSQPVLWHSADGADWQRVEPGLVPAASAVRVAATGELYYAAVLASAGNQLWRSADGTTWEAAGEIPTHHTFLSWGDGLVGIGSSEVVISKEGVWGGTDALDPSESGESGLVQPTDVIDPEGPDDVGRFWRRVPIGGVDRVRELVVAGDRLWLTGTTGSAADGQLRLLSSGDGVSWTEHDLAALGLPDDLAGATPPDPTTGRAGSLLLADGDEVVLVLSRYPVDNNMAAPRLAVVRGTADALDVWQPESFQQAPYPGPSNGLDLRYGTPSTGVVVDGRLVLAGRGQWWLPFQTADSSVLVTVIDPDRSVTFVGAYAPPFGGRENVEPVAMLHTGSEFVLIGDGSPPGAGFDPTVLVWRSPDGLAWTGPQAEYSERQERNQPEAAVHGPAGIVVHGNSDRYISDPVHAGYPTMWWHSPDGQSWSAVLPDVAATGIGVRATWVFGDRYYSLAATNPAAVVLTSADGVTWEVIAEGVPEVSRVSVWGDGVVGTSTDHLFVSKPGFTAGELVRPTSTVG